MELLDTPNKGRFGNYSILWRFRNGGALTTCLRSFANCRYPGGFLGRSFASALPFGSDITPPPDWSGYPKSGAFQRPSSVLSGSVGRQYLCARYSGMT